MIPSEWTLSRVLTYQTMFRRWKAVLLCLVPLVVPGMQNGAGDEGIHAGYLCHYGDLVCVWASHLPSVEMCWTCTAIKKPPPKMDLLWNMTDFRGQIPLYLGKPLGCFFGERMLSVFPGYLAVVMKHLGVSVNLASWGALCKQINDADGYMIHQDDIVRILIDYDTLWYTHSYSECVFLFLVGLMICKFVFRDHCSFRWFIPEVDLFMATVRRLIQCIEILAVVSDMSWAMAQKDFRELNLDYDHFGDTMWVKWDPFTTQPNKFLLLGVTVGNSLSILTLPSNMSW